VLKLFPLNGEKEASLGACCGDSFSAAGPVVVVVGFNLGTSGGGLNLRGTFMLVLLFLRAGLGTFFFCCFCRSHAY